MEGKIENIVISVGEKTFELTEDEARTLKFQLDKIFNGCQTWVTYPTVEFPAYPAPVSPYYDTTIWTSA